MSATLDIFKRHLQQNGYSVTIVRTKIFEALEQKEPQTMTEIIASLTDVDRASVYRTINLFEKLQIIHRLQMGWKYKLELSDQFHYHHHHISCSKCARVIPLKEDVAIEQALDRIAAEYNFQSLAHQIEISGICAKCR